LGHSTTEKKNNNNKYVFIKPTFNPSKDEAQTALFKDTVRAAL